MNEQISVIIGDRSKLQEPDEPRRSHHITCVTFAIVQNCYLFGSVLSLILICYMFLLGVEKFYSKSKANCIRLLMNLALSLLRKSLYGTISSRSSYTAEVLIKM